MVNSPLSPGVGVGGGGGGGSDIDTRCIMHYATYPVLVIGMASYRYVTKAHRLTVQVLRRTNHHM